MNVANFIDANSHRLPQFQFCGCQLNPLEDIILVFASLFEPSAFVRIGRKQSIVPGVKLVNNEKTPHFFFGFLHRNTVPLV